MSVLLRNLNHRATRHLAILRSSSDIAKTPTTDQLPDSVPTNIDDLSDEDAEWIKRDCSRMYRADRFKMRHVDRMPDMHFDYQTKRKYQRSLYAKYGRASGVDPGIQWPTVEEMRRQIADEELLQFPTLQESWQTLREKRAAEADVKRRREAVVTANMKEMQREIAQYRERLAATEHAAQSSHRERQALLDEAREILGYDVDPRDERFQQLIEEKQAAEKKEQRALRRKDKEAKLQAALTSID